MTDDNKECGEAYEAEHVHAVYEQIAAHFSSTRYKPWPIVERFLRDLIPGSIGADVGCGNGKYLTVNPNIYIVASDRSFNLARIAAKHQPHSTIVADNLLLPHPPAFFDFAISIAVIHHFSTPERRAEAVKAVLSLLKPSPSPPPHAGPEPLVGGRALFYVWALEQKDSRRGWDKGHSQDVMVPWVMKTPGVSKIEQFSKTSYGTGQPRAGEQRTSIAQSFRNSRDCQSPQDCYAAISGGDQKMSQSTTTFHRYYHLYSKGELENDILKTGGTVIASGYEKDNWWAIAERQEPK